MFTNPSGWSDLLRRKGAVAKMVGCRNPKDSAATRFLADVERDDPQLLMARVTGQYRRGNERTAKNHPRNRAR